MSPTDDFPIGRESAWRLAVSVTCSLAFLALVGCAAWIVVGCVAGHPTWR